MHQLANDEASNHPIAATILKRDFFVDDLVTGTSTRKEAEFLRNDLMQLLKRGGFTLRKWASNEPSLMVDSFFDPTVTHMSLDRNSSIKTLGIQWESRQDSLFYSVGLLNMGKEITKRSILL